MILIVCLDNDNGMMFNHRRQSQDKELRHFIIDMTKGKKLWMNHYTKLQFEEEYSQINVDENFMLEAATGDYCFAENIDVAKYKKWVERIIIFRWNRKYPSDLIFNIPLSQDNWTIKKSEDFSGFSHDKISMEVYEK